MKTQDSISMGVIYENDSFLQIIKRIVRDGCSVRAISAKAVDFSTRHSFKEQMDDPDYIVIGANGYLSSWIARLITGYGCCEPERVIEFYKVWESISETPKVQRVMNNPRYDELTGLVMGNSHVENGLVSSMLPGKVCNIATGGSDIYYNLKSLEYCLEHHKNHLRDLGYVIFDMYDYSYFNVDVSLGKKALYYYTQWGGYIWDGHHFDHNKNFSFSFEELRQTMYTLCTEKEKEVFHFLFPEAFSLTGYEEFDDDYMVKNVNYVVSQEELDEFDVESSILTKEFPDTWKENVECFEKILIRLREINPTIKIRIMLMPRHQCTEVKMKKYDDVLRPKFMQELHKMQETYDFQIYDLKGLSQISSHREYYYDPEHLNRQGAECFTKFFVENILEF